MTSGRNKIDENFRVKLNKRDIAEIVENSKQLRITDQTFLRGATYEDVMAAYTILSLRDFLETRHVPTAFDVVLSE